jgi:hypothetical protein
MNLNPFKLAELGLLVALLALALLRPQLLSGWRVPGDRRLRRLASRPFAAIVLTAVTAFTISAGLSTIRGPVPGNSDEFSHLLIADTFVHGRVTNPTHPHWEHFEATQVLQRPSYTGKFPPGQGILLALGTLVGGRPVTGLWIGVSLLAGSLCWMLQGFVPRRWALVGGIVSALRFGTSYWSTTFFGVTLAATGGALLLGACGRVLYARRITRTQGAVAAIGLLLMAFTRPFEGLLAGATTLAIVFCYLLRRRQPGIRLVVSRMAMPFIGLMAIGLSLFGYYNWRVAGSPLLAPYEVYTREYVPAPVFLWQAASAIPIYRHQSIKDWHVGAELPYYLKQKPWRGLAVEAARKCGIYAGFFLGPPFVLILLVLPFARRLRGVTLAAGVGAVLLAGLLTETYGQAHYASPGTAAAVLLIVQGLRIFNVARLPRAGSGPAIVRAMLITCAVSAILAGFEYGRALRQDNWGEARADLDASLRTVSGRQLVFVRYGPGHPPIREWVHNEADIDASQVVWAHQMSADQDRALIQYFNDRHVWIVEADSTPPRLTPYLHTR